ncbi:cytochrome-c peroxidase [Acidihalobacter yilgarnensis]|uniref:Cytochrome-c peroxidase n=1 Tax=Acidihalobacter yilgarnensis TaxID=2819280 RepID=A0A1D8ILG7_9GAMM|nr:cytochrome c peroxidase [Acidihalobacter yilgarnensis]AOU97307.1 cytochrome-c peroxidase [Acidihalobacter yilgarnensis]
MFRHDRPSRRLRRTLGVAAVFALLAGAYALIEPVVAFYPLIPLASWLHHPVDTWRLAHGENPHPVRLMRPPVAPLSAMARLGRDLFYDRTLSGSGRMSCASCHSPQHAYGPPGDAAVMFGGPDGQSPGYRAVPSLMYLERQPPFSVGPDNAVNETLTLRQKIARSVGAPRLTKTAGDTAGTAHNLVPQGGLFWDGRVDTLQQQADGPLFNTFEMDAGSPQQVAARLAVSPYARDFRRLFGPGIFDNPNFLVSEALFALARYQIEDPSFHPYRSRYDAWLGGKARLDSAELRGYLLFNDPAKGDCAACHVDRPTPDGLPPLFTDHQYEALGVPRNPAIPANRDPHYYDLGLCGPFRKDLARQHRYCGLFLTPTLRNVATRHTFFHNGVYHTLMQVLAFYNFRDTDPERIYPRDAQGRVEKFNDLPTDDRGNVDTIDPPLNRHAGERPALTRRDMQDIVAFLGTLTDRPDTQASAGEKAIMSGHHKNER